MDGILRAVGSRAAKHVGFPNRFAPLLSKARILRRKTYGEVQERCRGGFEGEQYVVSKYPERERACGVGTSRRLLTIAATRRNAMTQAGTILKHPRTQMSSTNSSRDLQNWC